MSPESKLSKKPCQVPAYTAFEGPNATASAGISCA